MLGVSNNITKKRMNSRVLNLHANWVLVSKSSSSLMIVCRMVQPMSLVTHINELDVEILHAISR